MPTKNEFNYDDIKRMFKTPIASYIKLTAEYEFFSYKVKKYRDGIYIGCLCKL